MQVEEIDSNTLELQSLTKIASNLFRAQNDDEVIIESTLLRMKMDQFREKLRRQRIFQLQLKTFHGTIVNNDVFEDQIITFQNQKQRKVPDNFIVEDYDTTASECEYSVTYQMQELKNGMKRFYIQ